MSHVTVDPAVSAPPWMVGILQEGRWTGWIEEILSQTGLLPTTSLIDPGLFMFIVHCVLLYTYMHFRYPHTMYENDDPTPRDMLLNNPQEHLSAS